MFMPMGWLGEAARAVGYIPRAERVLQAASKAGKIGEAASGAIKSALGGERAGQEGFGAVREALRTPGDIGKEAVERELQRPGTAYYRDPEGYQPRVVRGDPMSAAEKAAAKRDVVPPAAPAGAPSRLQRAEAAIDRFPGRAGIKITAYARKHPTIAGAVRGAAGSATQPVVGSGDYWSQKEQQMAAGALLGMGAASPVARKVARTIATHGAIHGAGAALLPHAWGLHYPLHHLARRAAPLHAPTTGRPWSPAAQLGAGAAGGQLQTQGEPRLQVHRDPRFADPQGGQ